MKIFEKKLVKRRIILESLDYSIFRLPIILVSLTLTVMLTNGCSQQSAEYEQEQSSADVEYAAHEEAAEDMNGIASELPTTKSGKPNSLSISNLSGDSKQVLGSQITKIQIAGKTLLISARANFKVADVVKSSNAIERLTQQQGGYVALSNISNHEKDSRTFTKGSQDITLNTYYRQATMTVRIPKAKVSEFLKQVQQQVAFLNEQEFTAQDVTLDIYREQLAARLNSDMASELSQERLNSKNAKDQGSNVNSIAATYAARQQQEYAQLEQMNIADKVKYSTIELTFSQPDSSYKETTQNLDVIIDAERPSFGAQVSPAFKQGWDTLQTVVITLIRLWWLVVLAGVLYIIYRGIKAAYRKLFRQKNRRRTLKRQQITKTKNDSHIDDSVS
jgi:hypothetical protein